MSAYYNEIDAEKAAWIRELIACGVVSPGEVDERSILDVRADDLRTIDREGLRPSRIATNRKSGYLTEIIPLSAVPTPQKHDERTRGNTEANSQSELCSVATPSARDWKDTSGMSQTGVDPDGSIRSRLDQLPRQAQLADSGQTATGGTAATKSTDQLDPAYSRWLQGLPPVFCDCAVLATQSLLRSPRPSSARISKSEANSK